MNDEKIQLLLREAALRLIQNTIAPDKIQAIEKKHSVKAHFVPTPYRIFGGLMQSLNIQFGNFIQILLHTIIEEEPHLEIVEDISGHTNVKLELPEGTDHLIDSFITSRQSASGDLAPAFDALIQAILAEQNSGEDAVGTSHDVDVLFRDTRTGIYYYVELKYNDDHDTGKFVDINRKFLKTYAGLVKKLGITDTASLKPILYYLNPKVMKENIFVPEETHIYRGARLFDEFMTMKYADLEAGLKHVSDDPAIIKLFDDLYVQIRERNVLP